MASKAEVASHETAPLQIAAGVAGVIFLLLGILGFIPGVTTNYGEATFATPASEAMILGIFGTNFLMNIVYLVFGIVGVAAARRTEGARYFLVIAGVIYVLLWILGLAIDTASSLNFLAVNTATSWLHFVLGVLMLLANALPAGPGRR